MSRRHRFFRLAALTYTGEAPLITSAAPPAVNQWVAYSHTFTAVGTKPIRWSVSVGSLPSGLALDSATGVLNGSADLAGSYSFTVAATNDSGVALQPVTFVVNSVVPALVAPAAGAVENTTTPAFTWTGVGGAVSYDIEIAETLTGTPTATGIEALTYTPGSALTVGVDYYWRVRAVNAGGVAGAWSAARTFVNYGTQYFVNAATGNDTNSAAQAQNPATPWATITKATLTVPTNINACVRIADGTYNESSSGLHYLLVQRNQTGGNYCTFVAQNGASGAVIINGETSTTYRARVDGSSYQRFRWLTFANATTDQLTLTGQVRLTSNNNHIEFLDCAFNIRSVVGRTIFGLMASFSATENCNNIVVKRCTFLQTGAANVGLLRMDKSADGVTLDGITIEDCTFAEVPYYAIYIAGASNVLLDGISASNTSNAVPCVSFGENADAGRPVGGTIQDSVISSTLGHALLVGAICDTVTLDGNTITGGDQGLVLKHCNNITVTDNIIGGGSINAFYCKGATNVTASGNTISNGEAVGFRVGVSGDGTKCQNIDFQNNAVVVTGTGDCMVWGDDTHDTGGGVCDHNTYNYEASTGNVGDVRATANITTLAALQAAWSGYGDDSNDANSTVIAP